MVIAEIHFRQYVASLPVLGTYILCRELSSLCRIRTLSWAVALQNFCIQDRSVDYYCILGVLSKTFSWVSSDFGGMGDPQPIGVCLLVDLLDSILHPGLSTPLSKLPTSKSRPDVGRSDKHHRELHTDGCRIHARSPDYVWQAIRKL